MVDVVVLLLGFILYVGRFVLVCFFYVELYLEIRV